MFNSVAGEHRYAPDISEHDVLVSVEWNDEGASWNSDDNHSVLLYLDYNPNAFANNNNCTSDYAEHSWLLSFGWRDEGYVWHGTQ